MDYIELLFIITNAYVMPFWLFMLLLPSWEVTNRVTKGWWMFIPLIIMYVGLWAITMGSDISKIADLANPQFTTMLELLGSPNGLVLAWIHLLAFDLFVGRWMFLDNKSTQTASRVNNWLMSIPLVCTLLAGPLGLGIYLGLKQFSKPSSSNV